MSDHPNVTPMSQEISFTIDGQPFTTTDRRQPAAALLRLGGLDPGRYDLGELQGQGGKTRRFADDDIVTIRPSARFVSIRHAADVA
jgi:hypothetical protein